MSKDLAEGMLESLEKTFDDIQERGDSDETPEEAPEPVEAEEPKEPEEEPKEEAPVEAKAEPTPESKPVESKPTRGDPDKSIVNPPNTWRPAAKAEWSKVPEGVRKEILKREADAIRGVTEHKEMANYGNRVQTAIAPYQAYFKSKNIDPLKAVDDAFNLSYSLSTSSPQEKGVILKRIAQQYGADLSVFNQQANPEQDKLQRVLAPLQQQIEELKQERLNSLSQERQRQTETLEQQVVSFAGETDETGSLKHPYFDNVRDLMAVLLESGQASQLDEAYAIAVESHRDTRGLSKQTANRGQDEKERTEKARKNDRLNIPRRGAPPAAKAPQGSMRDTIEAAYNRLQNA